MMIFTAKQRPAARILLAFTLLAAVLLYATGCSGDTASEFQAEGRKLMEQNNPGGAVVFFKNALDKEPNNFTIRFDLGKAYFKMGKLDQAGEEFEKCLRQQENNLELHLEMARLYTLQKNTKKALEHIARIEKANGPTAETRELAALNYSAQGNLMEAELALKEALTINPGQRSASAALIRIYLARRMPKEAMALSEKLLAAEPEYREALQLRAEIASAVNDMETAEKCYRKLVLVVPDEVGAYYMLGNVLLRRGNIEEAKRVRDDMRSRFEASAFEHMLNGMIAYQEGDYQLASTMFQKSVDVAPTQDGLYRLALSLYKLGNTESALSNLRRILDYSPQHAPALQLTAQILLDQGRLDEARDEAERLVSFHPDRAPGYYLLGTILSAQGKNEPALEALRSALEINPAMSEAAMRRSSILMAEKRVSEAVEELSRALSANSGNVSARAALFNYYIGKRDLKKAEKVVDEGLEERPSDALLLTMKASLHSMRKNNHLAIETLEKVRESTPDFLPAQNLLLRLHMLAGRNEEALAICDDYLSRHPEATDQLITSAALLDGLGRSDEARQRLEKANALGEQRALIILVRRELIAQQPDKAEQYLLTQLREKPSQSARSLLASFYVERNLPEKALTLYDKQPAVSAGETALGKYRIYMAQGDYEQALAQAGEITKLDPRSAMGPLCAASALEKLGKNTEALETLENAYRDLQQSQLLAAIGNLCLRTGQTGKAESYFRTALLKNPNDAQALLGQGNVMMRQKRFDAAIASYEKALELSPTNINVANNLAMAIAQEGKNPARAVDIATKAFVAHPENPHVADTLGFCLLANKQVDEALVILKNGVQAHPDSAILHFRYGVALTENGQKREGADALKKSLELGDFPEKETARKMLHGRGNR